MGMLKVIKMIKEERNLLHKQLQMLTEESELYGFHESAAAFARLFKESLVFSLIAAVFGVLFLHCVVDLVKLINSFFRG